MILPLRPILSTLFLRVGTLLLVPFTFVSLLLLPLFFLPFIFLRLFVGGVARFCNPLLGKMVTAPSTILFAENKLGEFPKSSIVTQIRLEGVLDFGKLVAIVEKSVLPAKSKNGDLKYPEFTQYLTNWGGYLFFKNKEDFTLNQHVFEVTEVIEGEAELDNFHLQLQQKPWVKGMPLWDLWLVKYRESKEDPPTSHLFFRTHHILADGYSLLSVFTKHLCKMDSSDVQRVRPSLKSPSPLQVLSLPFKLAWELSEALLFYINPFSPRTPFRAQKKLQKKLGPNSYLLFAKSNKIPLALIKEVKDGYSCSFSAVISSALSAGLQEGMKVNSNVNVKEFPILIPFPVKGHPDKLRNHWSATLMKSPTGNDSLLSPVERLRKCEQETRRMKRSALPVFAFLLWRLGGNLPTSFYKSWLDNYLSTAGLTSFPAGKGKYNVGGVSVKEFFVTLGTLRGTTGVIFTAVSFGDFIRFCAIGDASVFEGKEDLKIICDRIEFELYKLKKGLNCFEEIV